MGSAKSLMSPDDFFRTFEGLNHQLIDGVPQAMPPPKPRHGRAQLTFASTLAPRFDRKHGSPGGPPGGWWLLIEAAVRYGHLHLFSHDMAGWRRDRAPKRPEQNSPISIRPDWVCEILSSNVRDDRVRKKQVLNEWQVPSFWLVDTEDREIRILEWDEEDYEVVGDYGLGFVGTLPPFDGALSVEALFGADEE